MTLHRRLARVLVVAGVGASSLAGVTEEAAAATFIVSKLGDTYDGTCGADCSLRDAIAEANFTVEPDVVVLSPGTYVLSITGGGLGIQDNDLEVENDLTITGAGAAETVIDGGGSAFGHRVFTISAPADVTISDLTITNTLLATGEGGGGAADIAAGASLGLGRVAVTRHSIGQQSGGAIDNAGTLTVVDSLFTDNEAGANGGAVSNSATATFTNVTFSGNRSRARSGGLEAGFGTSVTRLNGVTFTGNVADSDGDGNGSGGAFVVGNVAEMRNTISAGNSGVTRPDCSLTGGSTLTSLGHNLVGDTDGCIGYGGPGDLSGVDPKLGPLANNGGPTMTHALAKGSKAVGGGSGCPPADQRGLPRTGGCDIGAYELVLCRRVPVSVIGTNGNDRLAGGRAPQGLLGLGGRDRLAGKGGKDGLCGGPGKDVLRGGGGRDGLDGGPGRDLCVGQGGRDWARGCEVERSI